MVRRWSYIKRADSLLVKSIIRSARVKLFKSCVRMRNISSNLTHLTRKRYFARRSKNSLLLFAILASKWFSDFLSLRKNTLWRKLTLSFTASNFSHAKNKTLFSYNSVTPRKGSLKVGEAFLAQRNLFSPYTYVTIMLLKSYRSLLITLFLLTLTK
jgi:hypothetical protein